MTKPVYYRWTYSPSTGDVDLSHNHECHPSKVPTHGTMCQRRPESDLSVGYAYRLQDGWRILDGDHRPVTDPHVIAKVIAQVSQVESFNLHTSSQGGQTVMPCPVCGRDGCTSCPIEPRTSRIHFGRLLSSPNGFDKENSGSTTS